MLAPSALCVTFVASQHHQPVRLRHAGGAAAVAAAAAAAAAAANGEGAAAAAAAQQRAAKTFWLRMSGSVANSVERCRGPSHKLREKIAQLSQVAVVGSRLSELVASHLALVSSSRATSSHLDLPLSRAGRPRTLWLQRQMSAIAAASGAAAARRVVRITVVSDTI